MKDDEDLFSMNGIATEEIRKGREGRDLAWANIPEEVKLAYWKAAKDYLISRPKGLLYLSSDIWWQYPDLPPMRSHSGKSHFQLAMVRAKWAEYTGRSVRSRHPDGHGRKAPELRSLIGWRKKPPEEKID